MSQLDLIAELRSARPVAPPELREHVRQLVAAAVPPRRRFTLTWRKSLILLAPVAAALVAVAIVGNQGHTSNHPVAFAGAANLAPMKALPSYLQTPALPRDQVGGIAAHASASSVANGDNGLSTGTFGETPAPAPLPVNAARIQRETASLSLRLHTAAAVSSAAKRADAITRSLHGYIQSADVNTSGKTGYANMALRVPRAHLSEEVSRIAALGKITAENLGVQDLQSQVSATSRQIARLQKRLAALRAIQPQTPVITRQIASLTAAVVRLQRANKTTIRQAHYATLNLDLSTPAQKPPVPVEQQTAGPFHGLGVAFHWIWVGAVYFLALGLPLLILLAAVWIGVRALRHRREEQLLSQA
jgi:hypothetical protein